MQHRKNPSNTDRFAKMLDASPAAAHGKNHVKPGAEVAADDERDPLERLAEEYAERYRRGERVTVEEYVAAHPQWGAEIRELFPAVAAMEQLHTNYVRHQGDGRQIAKIERLGDYRVLQEIARGGMGVIYEAEQMSLGRRVAVKVLPQNMLRSPRDVKRFQREAQTASRLHHTNIVPVFGFGEHDGHHYIVMQLIRGVGLDEILLELRQLLDGASAKQSASLSDQRWHAIKQSAAGLLNDTLIQGNATTRSSPKIAEPAAADRPNVVEGVVSRLTAPNPLQIRSVVGREYYRNVARIGLQAAQALSYAHHHDILHRDVKPGNLILDSEGVVWMADFGLAKVKEEGTVTCSGDIVGTLGYMAPERFEGIATAQSDLYSLGLTLHELLTFDRAYEGADRVSVMHQVTTKSLVPPRTRNPSVPRDLETIVLKATARLPADRYASADAMVADLQDVLADRPIKTRRMAAWERMYRWCRRNRTVAALAASVLVLLGVVGAMLTSGYITARAQQQRAEKTSHLAVSALDEIYSQFAPGRLTLPARPHEEAESLLEGSEMPLSKDVAVLLENLLRFYDELSRETGNAKGLASKSIAANRRVADIRRRLGEYEHAKTTYRQAIARFDDLSDEERKQEELAIEFARIQNGLGMVMSELGMKSGAIDAHAEAIGQFQHDNLSATERFELARSLYLMQMATNHARCSDKGEETEYLPRAITILTDLQQQHPKILEYRFLLARCYLDCCSGCNADGSLNCEQLLAIEMLEELVDGAPDVADYRYELGDAYRSIEFRQWRNRNHKRPLEDLQQSELRLRKALEITQNLSVQHPNIPQYAVLRKRLYWLLGYVLRDQNRLSEAAEALADAVERQRAVVQFSPDSEWQRINLYQLELDRAQILRDLAKYEEAKTSLEVTMADLKQLQGELSEGDSKTRHDVKNLLVRSHVTLSCLLNRMGNHEEADEMLRQAETHGR